MSERFGCLERNGVSHPCTGCGALSGAVCRGNPIRDDERELYAHEQAAKAVAHRAPSLQEVRENRAIFERAKAEFRRTLEGLVPDMETEVRVSFKARPGLPEMRQLGAEYREKALGGGDKPCECGAWDAWAKAILAGRGTYHVGEDAREQISGIIARSDRERGDAHASTARALGLAERADEERRRLCDSNGEASRVAWALRDLLGRCQCGSPDAKPDIEYVADRDAAIRSSAAPRWRPA